MFRINTRNTLATSHKLCAVGENTCPSFTLHRTKIFYKDFQNQIVWHVQLSNTLNASADLRVCTKNNILFTTQQQFIFLIWCFSFIGIFPAQTSFLVSILNSDRLPGVTTAAVAAVGGSLATDWKQQQQRDHLRFTQATRHSHFQCYHFPSSRLL